MARKPTYEKLEQRVKDLEKEALERRQAEEKFKRERNIFLKGPVVIFKWAATENWPAEYVSPNVTQFGYQADDFISGRIQYIDIIYPEDLERIVSEVRDSNESGVAFYEQEYRIIQADGEVRWVYDFTIVCRNDQNEITHYDGYILDTTRRKQAEEALQVSEMRLRDAQRVGAVGDWEFDIETQQINWSEQVYRLFERDPAQGPPIYEENMAYYYPEDSKKLQEQVRRAIELGEESDTDYRLKLPSGKSVYQRGLIRVQKDENGRVIKLYGIAQDITGRKQAEEALKESEARYRALFEGAAEGIIAADIETKEFIYANPAICIMLGYSKEELKQMGVSDIHPKEDLEHVISEFEAQARKEKTLAQDIPCLRKDGEIIFADITTSKVSMDGRECNVGLFTNTTERRRIEESMNLLSTAVKTSVDAISVASAVDGKLIFCNESFLKWWKVNGDYHNLTYHDCFDVDPDLLEEAVQTTMTGGWTAELRAKAMDGQTFPVLVTSSPVADKDGSTVGLLGIFKDITEIKKAEEQKEKLQAQLQQAQRMEAIGTIAGGIAHNFNNLLMGIMGNTSLMLLDVDSTHPDYERLKIIEKSVQNGSRLTRQLLGYAREGRYEIKPISLNQLVKEISDTFATTKKEIRVHQELDKDLRGINADQGQIEQALLNLFVNAADAMPGGGELFLKTMNVTHKDMTGKAYEVKPRDYVLVTIRDTGVGMDKKTKERIFDPFFTTKGLARGTGLGLASVYGTVKGHGGYIDVESKRGHGTTFSIYLPASERKVQEATKGAGKLIEGTGAILLVDDEEMVLDVGVQLLRALGYTVLEAKGGREAVEIYRENKDRIDMVLLDMVMPGMGGGEAYDKMKDINPDIKALLSSGYSIDGQATEILERGCNGFIQKPFDMKQLSRSIREILDQE